MAQQHLGIGASSDDDLLTKAVTRGVFSQCKNGEWTATVGGPQTTASMASGEMYTSTIIPARNCSVDQIGVNIIGSGASSSCRLGIYEMFVGSDGALTCSLIVDGGTITTTSTGIKTVSFTAVNLKYGRIYLVGIVYQSGTSPTLSFILGMDGLDQLSAPTSAVALTTSFGVSIRMTVGTGALGSTPTVKVEAGIGPLIAVHCSA